VSNSWSGRWMLSVISTAALLLLVLGAHEPADNSNEPRWVSLIQLIADPDAYDGRPVTVAGVLRLDFEGTALYYGEGDGANKVPTNGVWLRLEPERIDELKALVDHYVTLSGRFSALDQGHLGLFRGSIREIRDVTRLLAVQESRQLQIERQRREAEELQKGSVPAP